MRYLLTSLLCVFTLTLTAQGPDEYWIGLEEYAVHTEGELSGMTTWRMYIHMLHADDYLSACAGSEEYPWIMESTSSPAWYQHPDASETFANAIDPTFFSAFPELEYDSWLTIGVDDFLDPMELLSLADPIYDAFAAFEAGDNVISNTPNGNGWATFFPGLGADNAGFAGDDLKVLIGQLTTSGTISGTIYFQIFPMGIQSPDLRILLPILYAPTQCMDAEACNYDEGAWTNDDCTYIGAEACDCAGNVLDECGVCGGSGLYEGTTVDFGDGVLIPDDQSQCFTSQLSVTGFNDGTIISDANNDIVNLFMNFEHSYMGDLVITLICPNGQSLVVHQQGGVGTYLGEPVDNDTQPIDPGIGWDYWWDPGATNGTWVDNAGGTLPSGSYESVQPFTNLNGCPLNGAWEVEVCDLWASDNGFIFNWSLETSFEYEESCDCEGNILDECGVCGGDGFPCVQTCLDDDASLSAVGGCFNAVDLLGCSFYWDDILISELCPESCNNCPCDNDFNDNGVCDDAEVFGCTYLDAVNYNSFATADNGSCEFETTNACPADLDGNGIVATQDLLSFLSLFGEICE